MDVLLLTPDFPIAPDRAAEQRPVVAVVVDQQEEETLMDRMTSTTMTMTTRQQQVRITMGTVAMVAAMVVDTIRQADTIQQADTTRTADMTRTVPMIPMGIPLADMEIKVMVGEHRRTSNLLHPL